MCGDGVDAVFAHDGQKRHVDEVFIETGEKRAAVEHSKQHDEGFYLHEESFHVQLFERLVRTRREAQTGRRRDAYREAHPTRLLYRNRFCLRNRLSRKIHSRKTRNGAQGGQRAVRSRRSKVYFTCAKRLCLGDTLRASKAISSGDGSVSCGSYLRVTLYQGDLARSSVSNGSYANSSQRVAALQ